MRRYESLVQMRRDPRGDSDYWLGGTPGTLKSKDLDIDIAAVEQGYVSVTPLQFDLTNYQDLERLRSRKRVPT